MRDFLARFAGKRETREERDAKPAKVALSELRKGTAGCTHAIWQQVSGYCLAGTLSQRAFGLLGRARRKVAIIDCDSSIHEVYGENEKERATRTTGGGVAGPCT